jgi:hypothetical protein
MFKIYIYTRNVHLKTFHHLFISTKTFRQSPAKFSWKKPATFWDDIVDGKQVYKLTQEHKHIPILKKDKWRLIRNILNHATYKAA